MIKKIIVAIFIMFFCSYCKAEISSELANGIKLTIHPSYHNGKLKMKLEVSNGWARLNDEDYFYVGLYDSNDVHIVGIAFRDKDFTWDDDNVHRACKELDVEKSMVDATVGFRIKYPEWMDDI